MNENLEIALTETSISQDLWGDEEQDLLEGNERALDKAQNPGVRE